MHLVPKILISQCSQNLPVNIGMITKSYLPMLSCAICLLMKTVGQTSVEMIMDLVHQVAKIQNKTSKKQWLNVMAIAETCIVFP